MSDTAIIGAIKSKTPEMTSLAAAEKRRDR
jgi:hypothetical protein